MPLSGDLCSSRVVLDLFRSVCLLRWSGRVGEMCRVWLCSLRVVPGLFRSVCLLRWLALFVGKLPRLPSWFVLYRFLGVGVVVVVVVVVVDDSVLCVVVSSWYCLCVKKSKKIKKKSKSKKIKSQKNQKEKIAVSQ